MKKKLIAIAVAAALAPAVTLADTSNVTVYGRIHMSVDSVSGVAANRNNVTVNSNSSRFGVRGNESLGGGLKAIYQVEASVAADGRGAGSIFNGTRDTFLGLNGDFGTLQIGRMGFGNQYAYDSNLFADQLGDAATIMVALPGGRANGELIYTTPDMSGFNAALTYLPATSINASTGSTTGENSYGLKLNYAANGMGVSLTYFNVSTAPTTDIKPVSIAGHYDFGNGMLSAQYVHDSITTAGISSSRNAYNIGGKFNISNNSAVKAQYIKSNNVSGMANTGASQFAIGYDYNFSKRTGIYVVYAAVSNDAGAAFRVDNWGHNGTSTGPAAGEDPRGFGIGLTHNF